MMRAAAVVLDNPEPLAELRHHGLAHDGAGGLPDWPAAFIARGEGDGLPYPESCDDISHGTPVHRGGRYASGRRAAARDRAGLRLPERVGRAPGICRCDRA